MRDEINIMIGGEAGQGLQTVGSVLARSLVRSGYSIASAQGYQSRIRGGHNTFSIRAAVEEVNSPQEAVDIILAFNDETISLVSGQLAPGGRIVADSSSSHSGNNLLLVPYSELASPKHVNTAALGVASALLGLDFDLVAAALKMQIAKKGEEEAKINREALSAAFHWVESVAIENLRLSGPQTSGRTLLLSGNEAIALGALSAGCKFCAFYPMSPSTTIPLTLAAHGSAMGVVVEQAEDEIAAINMGIGASFAGAPALAATSGGGFALMTEGVSLAGMTETPIVIVVAQRPGPATGLPTRTEQADLEFVLHAGHGEFPRAILAPGSVEECFYLTRKAFFLAEETQGPVFLLTDQYLADSGKNVAPFNLDDLPGLPALYSHESPLEPYKRFQFTESGISPRLAPGAGIHLVVADSDEHTEDGHLTEDLSVRKRMVEKRLAKAAVIRREALQPVDSSDNASEILFVCWGSTKGAVSDASTMLGREGKKAGYLHFPQPWPLDSDSILPRLARSKEVVCVEGNAEGQFARLLKRETGFEIRKHIRRYDGLPITAEYIVRRFPAM